jgi:hypothetical protein
MNLILKKIAEIPSMRASHGSIALALRASKKELAFSYLNVSLLCELVAFQAPAGATYQ